MQLRHGKVNLPASGYSKFVNRETKGNLGKRHPHHHARDRADSCGFQDEGRTLNGSARETRSRGCGQTLRDLERGESRDKHPLDLLSSHWQWGLHCLTEHLNTLFLRPKQELLPGSGLNSAPEMEGSFTAAHEWGVTESWFFFTFHVFLLI